MSFSGGVGAGNEIDYKKRRAAKETKERNSNLDTPFVHYIWGQVHTPGKDSESDIVLETDDITKDELAALKLEGVPITFGHPSDGKTVDDEPHLVRGKIVKGVYAPDGSLWALAAINHETLKGCILVNNIKSGYMRGLSLGHIYEELRGPDGKFIAKRKTPDHVGIVEVPRREGCQIHHIIPREAYAEIAAAAASDSSSDDLVGDAEEAQKEDGQNQQPTPTPQDDNSEAEPNDSSGGEQENLRRDYLEKMFFRIFGDVSLNPPPSQSGRQDLESPPEVAAEKGQIAATPTECNGGVVEKSIPTNVAAAVVEGGAAADNSFKDVFSQMPQNNSGCSGGCGNDNVPLPLYSAIVNASADCGAPPSREDLVMVGESTVAHFLSGGGNRNAFNNKKGLTYHIIE